MQSVQSFQSTSPLENLLVHYMKGEIADRSWENMMETFDRDSVTMFERLAYARFVNEVLADEGPEALYVPKPDEVEELLEEIRR